MNGGDYASILAAIFAALAAWAVQRSSAKAAVAAKKLEADAAIAAATLASSTTQEAARMSADAEAYERARAFDISTIERQSAEIMQVRADNIHLNADVKRVNAENQELFIEREALRNEIRAMHEARETEREDCARVRQRLARAIAEGRLDIEKAVGVDTHTKNSYEDDYSEPGDSYPSD